MIPLLLIAQLAAGVRATDSTYTSVALRDLVAAVSEQNRRPPAGLSSYSSHIETEVSMLIRDTLGRENSAEIEQMATRGTWSRGGLYELHVVGYRSQSVGVPYSTLSIIRGWTIPHLYGERLSFGAYFARARSGSSSDTLVAVHPFASDRERYYRFSGGDTVTILQAGARRIPIVRIRVRPAFQSATPLNALDGEIEVDAERKQIVRMRGQIVMVNDRPSLSARISRAALGVTTAAYVEFVNSEIAGRYWLPTYQRTEFQASFAAFGQARPIIRIVSSISDIDVVESPAATDSIERRHVAITWAPPDSVDRFRDWSTDLGTQTSSVSADDFIDLAPDAWRRSGAPRLTWFPNTTSRILRFNRVEGAFVGIAPTIDFRNAAPGLSAGVFGGWAFSEKTVRGGAFASLRRSQATYGTRVERALASTNDFVLPFGEDPGIAALLTSIDDYDYVDRSRVMLSASRILGHLSTGIVTLQAGYGHDRQERARLERGLFGSADFRPNRGAANGAYALTSIDVEIHPNVSGDFVTPGLGARAHHEIAAGQLAWQRSEIGVSARRYLGPVSIALHGDGGIVGGSVIPPQQLFELGGNELLPGYSYKQFAGDRAALFRGFASYRFNVLKRPIRVREFYIPGFNPGLAMSVQGGWTEISSTAARLAVQGLGSDQNGQQLPTATNGARATFGAGLTFFSDILHVGVARPIDHRAPWRFVAGFGAAF